MNIIERRLGPVSWLFHYVCPTNTEAHTDKRLRIANTSRYIEESCPQGTRLLFVYELLKIIRLFFQS